MRRFVFALVSLLAAVPALAQRTVVTGTVTDGNGVPYSQASLTVTLSLPTGAIGAYLNGAQIAGTVGPLNLDNTGSFLVSLADNTQIKCANAQGQIVSCAPQTQWNFAVTLSPGVTPPLGTGPQTCGATLTISGSSQSVSSNFSTCPKLSTGSGVSSDNSITPTQAPFNAKWDVQVVYDANWLNASSVVNAPNETPFKTSDVGKIQFGTTYTQSASTNCTGAACGQVLIPQGTITVFTSAGQISVSTTSTGACTPGAFPGAICAFAYGTQDDTAAINAAAQAAWNTPGVCKALKFPSGYSFFSATILSVGVPNNPFAAACGFQTAGNVSNSDPAPQGAVAYGTGPGTSVFIPLPNFTFPCTGGVSGIACVGGTPVAQWHDFGVNGLGQAMAGLTRNVNLFEVDTISPACTGGTAWNLGLSQWGGTAVGDAGFVTNPGCSDPTFWNINVLGFGAQTCILGGTIVTTYTGILCIQSGPANNTAVQFNAQGIVNTFSSAFGGSFSNGFSVNFGASNMTWNSFGDEIAAADCGTAGGLNDILNQSTGNIVVNLDGDTIQSCPSSTGSTSFLFNLQGSGTMKLHVKNSTINGTGANYALIFTSANQNFYDDGGNIFTKGGVNSTIGGQLIADGHSVKGICTGSATASTTLGLYGTGPNATTTTCTSATIGSGIPVSGPRTLNLLSCKVSVAGTTASTCTVLVNGSSTGAPTCTIAAAATSCADDQHQLAVADGALVSLEFISGAVTTPSGVSMIVDYN